VISLVATLIASIFTFGTAPPLESMTCPDIVVRNSCAAIPEHRSKAAITPTSFVRK
jgi:hypothetical protein